VQACDGTKTVVQIVAQLLEVFPNSETARVSEETATFLTRLAEKGVIEFI
jgi:hypothetical protein